MPKIEYVKKNFGGAALSIIWKANTIIKEYAKQNLDLTLRQLYYQFVARGIIENTERSYKRLGSIVDDARLAGMIDWDAIEDRTRKLNTHGHWDCPSDLVEVVAERYHMDLWKNQLRRVEVWVEKEALVGVVSGICESLDVPYFACRGYSSQSAMWESAQRAESNHIHNKQRTAILYLGDHDPSGIDMTRDVRDRMRLLSHDTPMEVHRLALNMDQVEQYNPPPNPAKMTDSRAEDYVAKFGEESWELDALEPKVIVALVKKHIFLLMDHGQFKKDTLIQDEGRNQLKDAASWLREREDNA
jgi:hypothetical protein